MRLFPAKLNWVWKHIYKGFVNTDGWVRSEGNYLMAVQLVAQRSALISETFKATYQTATSYLALGKMSRGLFIRSEVECSERNNESIWY